MKSSLPKSSAAYRLERELLRRYMVRDCMAKVLALARRHLAASPIALVVVVFSLRLCCVRQSRSMAFGEG